MCEFALLLSSVSWGQVLPWVHKGHWCRLVPQPSVVLRPMHINKCLAFPGSPGFSAGISSVRILATTRIDLSVLLREYNVPEAFKEGGPWLPRCGVIPPNCDFKKKGELFGWIPWIENGSGIGHWGLPMPLNTFLWSVQRQCLLLPQRLCMGRCSLYHLQRRDSPLYRFSDGEKKNSLVVLLKVTIITVMIRPATSCKCPCCAKQFVNVI